jgi:magnesium transporter
MVETRRLNNITWVDMISPSPDEIREVMDVYHLHPLAAEELRLSTAKPRLDHFGHFLYVILHFPVLKHSHTMEKNQEVDFILGKDFLITARYDTIDPLHKFAKEFDVQATLTSGRHAAPEHAGHLFYSMLKKLYGAVAHELDYLEDEIRAIEEGIFEGNEQAMVVEISKRSRHLLDFKQALAPHRDVLESLKESSIVLFGSDFAPYAKAIANENFRVFNTVRNHLDVISELRETNNSLVYTKQNEAMKVLTIMAFVTFPLTLLAGIFGMNTEGTPLIGYAHDFWIIIGIMLVATTFFFAFFKYKKWL